MREKGQTEAAKTLETPVFSRGIEILTEKSEFLYHGNYILQRYAKDYQTHVEFYLHHTVVLYPLEF